MAGNWLNIAGGAAQGYNAGVEDDRRRQEFNYMQAQRARQLKKDKENDALEEQLKQVEPAGEYMKPQGYEAASDFQGPVPEERKKKTVRTEAQADRDRANVLARSGSLENITRSAALRNQAYQAEDMARRDKAAKGFETLSQAEDMLGRGDHVGAARLLQSEYAKHPDGHDIVFEQKDGVMQMGVAAGGKYVSPPVPVTAASVKGMIDRGYQMLSPEARATERKYSLDERTTATHETTAAAAKQNADSVYKKTLFETGDEAKAEMAAKTAYYTALAGKANREPTGGGDAYGTPIPMVDEKGQMTYGIPTKKGKDGPGITPVSMPAGWSFPKPQPVMNDQQKLAYTSLLKLEQDGAFDGEGGRAKRDKFIATNGLDKFMQADPIKQKLMAADPSKKPGAEAPAAAPPAAPAKKVTEVERIASDASKAKARAAVQNAQEELKKQFAAKEITPQEFSQKWAGFAKQMQAIQ